MKARMLMTAAALSSTCAQWRRCNVRTLQAQMCWCTQRCARLRKMCVAYTASQLMGSASSSMNRCLKLRMLLIRPALHKQQQSAATHHRHMPMIRQLQSALTCCAWEPHRASYLIHPPRQQIRDIASVHYANYTSPASDCSLARCAAGVGTLWHPGLVHCGNHIARPTLAHPSHLHPITDLLYRTSYIYHYHSNYLAAEAMSHLVNCILSMPVTTLTWPVASVPSI
jgi:hypothetical protein